MQFNMTTLLLAIGDFISIYLYEYMHRTFYGRKPWTEKYRILYTLVYVAVFFAILWANLQEIPILNFISMILAYMMPLFLCYRVDQLRGLGYFVFYLVGTLAIEIIMGISFGGLEMGMGNETRYEIITPTYSVMANMLELMLVMLICKYGRKDRDPRFDRITMLFAIMPLLTIAIILGENILIANHILTGVDGNQVIWSSVLLLVINAALFVILEKYTSIMSRSMELAEDKLRLQADADMMEMSARSMAERLEMTEKLMQQDRMMRHDRRHFEALLLSLLQEGRPEEAAKYLEERLAMEPKASRRYCDNVAVNAAVSHYLSQAEHENIRTEVMMNVPVDLRVDDMELAITIGNLLENAIHGCRNLPVEERRIRLAAKYREQLLLEVENTCRGTVALDEEGHPFSNEKDHGIGTRSVLAFADRTDSEIMYLAGDGIFKVRMII